MGISMVHDPLMTGGEGIPVPIKRRDWQLVQQIMEATNEIPHTEINPLTQSTSDVAWRAMDKIVELWKVYFREEASKFFSREAAGAKLHGTGATRDRSLRLLISAPTGLMAVIRSVFPGQSMGGDSGKQFWYKFANRYPEMRASETV